MEDNQYYILRVDFSENIDDAIIRLYWEYTGQTKTMIPTTYLFYPEYSGSSPYTVTISCPDGFTGDDPQIKTE